MKTMNWNQALKRLSIGESINTGEIAVARLSNNRFIVLRDGVVYDNHHSHMTVGLAIARALEAITGEQVIAPCVDCGAPRERLSYCAICWSRRTQGYKHRSAS